MTKITTADIRKRLLAILDRMEASSVVEIDVSSNFFWKVPDDIMYRMDAEPRDLVVGSIIDEYAFTDNISRDPSSAMIVQLSQLAPLLYYIGLRASSLEWEPPPSGAGTPSDREP